MSLIPLLFSDWWEDLDHPHRLFGQDFGVGIYPEQLLTPNVIRQYIVPNQDIRSLSSMIRNPLMYYRPSSQLMRKNEEAGTSTVQADKDKFQVILDVQQFKPEEINVKVVDKYVVVEGKHDEKQDEHGWISRQFVRKYMIPEQCDIDKVTSSLSSDGVLSISAPRKDKPEPQRERSITIQHTGKPAVRETVEPKNVEEKSEEKKAEEKTEKK